MEKNKQFESWFIENYDWLLTLSQFKTRPFPMQWGVYLEFFDSIGYICVVDYHPTIGNFSFKIINWSKKGTHDFYDVKHNSICDAVFYDTRQEAQTEAIKNAFEILNNENTD